VGDAVGNMLYDTFYTFAVNHTGYMRLSDEEIKAL